MSIGEFRMLDTEQVQDRGMEIMDQKFIFNRLVTKLGGKHNQRAFKQSALLQVAKQCANRLIDGQSVLSMVVD